MACSNTINCTCTYTSCSRHGKCCECVAYHRRSGEVPGCFFSKIGEKTITGQLKIYTMITKRMVKTNFFFFITRCIFYKLTGIKGLGTIILCLIPFYF